ncbi:MAG: TrmH family RNA methyltransferase [Nocardioides sp.]
MPRPTVSSITSHASSSILERLQAVGRSHDDVRRYSRGRRNLLPRADNVITVVGAWAHEVLLGTDAVVDVSLWCPGDTASARSGDAGLDDLAARVVARAQRAFRVSPRVLAALQPDVTAPALVSLVRLPDWSSAVVLTQQARLVLVADGIEYAGNLGTLVRTADACAADALVLTRATARVTHPKVFAASRGTVLTTPVLTYPTVAEARVALASAGFTAYVADPAGTTRYRDAGLGSGRTAVVVGSEGDGVSEEWRHGLTRVAIPMRGRADSLNVAVSAAVLLFEARARLDAIHDG